MSRPRGWESAPDSVAASHRSLSLISKVVSEPTINWQTIADWIDTEGSIDSTINHQRRRKSGGLSPYINRSIMIIQKDREPLDKLAEFLVSQGVNISVRFMKPSRTSFRRTPYFRLAIYGLEKLDYVIAKASPYFITEKSRRQVRRYHRFRHATADELRLFLQIRAKKRIVSASA